MMNPEEFANIAAAERDFWWYRGMQRILFRILDPIAATRRFQRVVEAGCGTGFLARELSQRYSWRMFPLDLGWQGLSYAQSFGLSRLVQADIAQFPFSDAAFDLLLSMDVVVHFPRGEEQRAFDEFSRVLEPGGLAVIRVSALDILRSRHSQFAHERQRFTRRRLIAQVENSGLRVKRCTYLNSMLMPVALAKFRLWEPLSRAAPASGVEKVSPWLDRLLHAPLTAEAALVGVGLNLPIGQSLLIVAEKPLH